MKYSMKIYDPYYQSIMKDLLDNKNPYYPIYFGHSEYIKNKAGKYLGTSFRDCPCFEYEGKVLMLFTNFPMFSGWIIRPIEEFSVQDSIPFKFAKHYKQNAVL